ncbi:MAG: hypothetical protein AB7G17_00595 [Phycisphaerales bacterium]
MHDTISNSLRLLIDALREAGADRSELREAMQVVGRWLQEAAGESERAPESESRGAERPPASTSDLEVVSSRSRLKAEACRWAVERRRLLEEGAEFMHEVRPRDAALVERGRAIRDCYLWMLDPYAQLPEDEALERVAGCYEALATVADLARDMVAAGETVSPAAKDLYYMFAEAQSGLRAGLVAIGVRPDRDQIDSFSWLRDRTFAQRVFIDRHMKLEDPADPANWEDLKERTDKLRATWMAARSGDKELTALKNRARHHAQRLMAGSTGDEARHDWEQLFGAVEGMIQRGLPPSSKEVTDPLLDLADKAPAELELNENEIRALEAARKRRTQLAATARRDAAAEEEGEEEDDGPVVREAAEILRGKVVVLIGGERRPGAAEALERSLALEELRWVETKPHESVSKFESDVSRPDVDVVLLAIRWTSHSHGDVQKMCERYGKAFVRLPGGYSPSQVAMQVIGQVSDRLREVQNGSN